jgi:four helix bundle protein
MGKKYIRPHYDLDAWKEAIKLVKLVYKTTQSFPKEELYCLVTQMRRAAISIPSNIAEGAARTSPKEFARFISIARGSLSELETQILISVELGYIEKNNNLFSQVDKVSRIITGLHKKVSSQ